MIHLSQTLANLAYCQNTHKQLAHCCMTFGSPFQSSTQAEAYLLISTRVVPRLTQEIDMRGMMPHQCVHVQRSTNLVCDAWGLLELTWRIDISPVELQRDDHSLFLSRLLVDDAAKRWKLMLCPNASPKLLTALGIEWTGMGHFMVATLVDQDSNN